MANTTGPDDGKPETPREAVTKVAADVAGDLTDQAQDALRRGQRIVGETRRRAGVLAGDVKERVRTLAADARQAASENKAAVGIGAALGVGAIAAVAAVIARRGEDDKAPKRAPATRKADSGGTKTAARRGAAKPATANPARARKSATKGTAAARKPATRRKPAAKPEDAGETDS